MFSLKLTKLFEKRRKETQYEPIELINVSGRNIATGMMNGYILSLKKEEPFKYLHMGYDYRNEEGELRFIIYAWHPNSLQIRYFKDSCPAMIEEAIIKTEQMSASWLKWDKTNREELVEYREN